MDERATIEAAASRFVRAAFRERFVHEALKKPERLMARVAHEIDAVFERRFRGGRPGPAASGACLLFELTGRRRVTTWRDAMDQVGRGGGGFLVIAESGRCFFAEAEGEPPPAHYAGSD